MAQQKKYQAAHPEQRRAVRKKRRALGLDRSHRLHQRIKNRDGLEQFSRLEIFERDGWTCHICGEACDQSAQVPSPLAATIDHLTPLAHGGQHNRANVKCAHFSCNSKRGASALAECA